jgi:hypothetical protein
MSAPLLSGTTSQFSQGRSGVRMRTVGRFYNLELAARTEFLQWQSVTRVFETVRHDAQLVGPLSPAPPSPFRHAGDTTHA